jgi:hypothetical protein
MAFATTRAGADLITVDENGNGTGTVGSGYLSNDPGPGGLNNVLTYNLPFTATQGDVEVFDFPSFVPSDVIRFNGDGTLIFYSNPDGVFDSMADTSAPPGNVYANLVVGPEGLDYTPGVGDPGYDPSGPTYRFLSTEVAPTPEPSTLALAGLGGLALAGYGRWRKRGTVV